MDQAGTASVPTCIAQVLWDCGTEVKKLTKMLKERFGGTN